MTESQSTMQDKSLKTKKVSIQERSVFVGDTIFVNGHGVNLALLKQRFFAGGYQLKETAHFLLFTRSEAPATILVHWFAPEEMNADIKHYIMQELKSLKLLTSPNRYGEIFAGIIGSFFPDDASLAWHQYGAKTLQRFLLFLSTAQTPSPLDFYGIIGVFAAWYQRVCELFVGESFLDAGCESGFLPLVVAERIPFMQRVVGVDIRPDMFNVAKELAEERHLENVQFIEADLLSADFTHLGRFDMVTALGVIEHFSEGEMFHVLDNLLKMTIHRLILIVPYEEEAETIYEHKQIFTPEKLEALGKWCLERIKGKGRMWMEDCDGGLLMIEKRDL